MSDQSWSPSSKKPSDLMWSAAELLNDLAMGKHPNWGEVEVFVEDLRTASSLAKKQEESMTPRETALFKFAAQYLKRYRNSNPGVGMPPDNAYYIKYVADETGVKPAPHEMQALEQALDDVE